MKKRARAVAFAVGALACAGLSAAVAGTAQAPGDGIRRAADRARDGGAARAGDRDRPPRSREVSHGAPGAGVVRPARCSRHPRRGARPQARDVPLPAGSYLTASAFKALQCPGGSRRGDRRRARRPVEITVTGAGALAATRTDPGDRVDVVVSGDSAPGRAPGGPTSRRRACRCSACARRGRAGLGSRPLDRDARAHARPGAAPDPRGERGRAGPPARPG